MLKTYSRNVRKSLLFMSPQAAGRVVAKNMVKLLKWKTDEVTRDVRKAGERTFVRYRVRVSGEGSRCSYSSRLPITGSAAPFDSSLLDNSNLRNSVNLNYSPKGSRTPVPTVRG